jgi:hypothetical protein
VSATERGLDLDGASVRGLVRRLDEERITAEYWHKLAEGERETTARLRSELAWEREVVKDLRARVIDLRLSLSAARRDGVPLWRSRLGWLAVGVIVALLWVWATGGAR